MEIAIRLRGRSAGGKYSVFSTSNVFSFSASSFILTFVTSQPRHNGSTYSTNLVALLCTVHAIGAFDIIDCIDVVFMADSILLGCSLEAR